MKFLLPLIVSIGLYGQNIKPKLQLVGGVHYAGSLTYDMRQTPPSGQLGIVYTLKDKKLIVDNLGVFGTVYYDFINTDPIVRNNTYYMVKIQVSKEVVEGYNFAYYLGYVDAFKGNIMGKFRGTYKTNISYGFGIQIPDDYLTAELLFESIAGYPHISAGININIYNFLK